MRQLCILLLTAISTALMAQVRLAKSEIYIGTTHGVTASMLSFTPKVSQGFLQGYTGGIVFRYIAEKNLGMQAEINFSQRGWKEDNDLYTRQLNYIELPFMTHIFIGNKNRIFLNLGPKISYLISEKVQTNNTITSTEIRHTNPIKYPFDYGICGGLGFLVKLKGNVFQLDTRAYYGLSDVFSNEKQYKVDASKNATISVNLAWLIQVK